MKEIKIRISTMDRQQLISVVQHQRSKYYREKKSPAFLFEKKRSKKPKMNTFVYDISVNVFLCQQTKNDAILSRIFSSVLKLVKLQQQQKKTVKTEKTETKQNKKIVQ